MATMVVFATLLACVGQFGATVAALRESSWGAYLRTLPAGAGPLAISSLLTGMVVVLCAVVPIVLVGAFVTGPAVPAARLPAGVGALLVAAVVFTLLGLAVGSTLPLSATVVVTSILVLVLAVGGGMFSAPGTLPAVVEVLMPYVPTRGATDLVLAALTGHTPDPVALVMLGVWAVVLTGATVWGFRRHEGRRYR
jgi:ABC-2 type transport system permease protein